MPTKEIKENKLKNERNKHIQHLISIDLNFFINQIKLRYLKSILQSRSSLLPSYCRWNSISGGSIRAGFNCTRQIDLCSGRKNDVDLPRKNKEMLTED